MSDKDRLDRSRRSFLGTSMAVGAGLAIAAPLRSLAAARPAAPDLVPPERITRAVALSLSAVVKSGLGDVLPRPFEIDLLAASPHLQVAVFDTIVGRLARRAFAPSDVTPIEYVLLPKRQPGAFRRCAVIDPVDLISYLALAVLAAPRVEACRPPCAERSVFSFRFSGRSPDLFNRQYTYGTFVRHVSSRCAVSGTNVLVTADIEYFYDRLALDTVRASLLRCAVEAWVVDFLVDLLSFWSAGTERGLPVGSNASRILAEAVLAGVDDELREAGVDYARFVDDFRLFAPDVPTAEAWLRHLARALRARGLRVNHAKTRLVDPETMAPLREVAPGWPPMFAQGDRPSSRDKPDAKPAPKPAPDDKTKPTPEPKVDDQAPGSLKNNPRRFRRPRRGEYRRLRELDLVRLGAEVTRAADGSSASFREFVTAAIYQGDVGAMGAVLDLLVARHDGLAYVVSALAATADRLPDDIRRHVATRFAAMLLTTDPPVHAALETVDLLASEGYRRPDALLAYLDALGSRAGTYLGRAVLDGLARCETTLDRRTVARLYGRLNAWGRRALLTPALAGSTAAGIPAVIGRARTAAATDPFMGALLARLENPHLG